MTPGRAAIASALSMISSGVTQTGQPGPWIISTPSGSSWSMPCRMIEWVWPPQTSIIAHGWVVTAWIWSSSRLREVGVAELVEVLHASSLPARLLPRAAPTRLPRGEREAVAELLLEDAELSKLRERLLRRLLVEPLDRETDVHDDVLADLHVGDVLPGRPPCARRRSRPGPSRCRHALDGQHPSRNCQAHGRSLSLLCRRAWSCSSARRADQDLAEGDATVVRGQQPRPQHGEPALRQQPRRRASSSTAFWNTPPPSATTSEPGPLPRAGSASSATSAATAAWKRAATSSDRGAAARRRAPPPRTTGAGVGDQSVPSTPLGPHPEGVRRQRLRRAPRASASSSTAASAS